jgi:hypothetical protein
VLLGHQAGIHQLGQVLANRVVVQAEVISQLAMSTARVSSAMYWKIEWRVGSPSARACSWSVVIDHRAFVSVFSPF